MTFLRLVQKTLGRFGRWLYGVSYVGLENIPMSGSVVVASNHIHLADPIMHGCCLKREFHTMAKKELFRFKPLGWFLSKLGAFPVERGHGDRGAVKKAAKILENGELLLIFPEGTRNKDRQNLLPFKSGAVMFAMLTDSPIVPAVIHAPNGVGLFQKVTIEYGKPIAASEFGTTEVNRSTIKEASGILRDRMKSMLENWSEPQK